MFWKGSLSKALTDAKGTQHLIFVTTGPAVDGQGERMSAKVLEKFDAAAKAGKIALTPSHDVPMPLGKSVDSTRNDAGDSLIDFALDADDPLAAKAYRLIDSGEWHPQVSMGAEHVTRSKTFDAALGKSITEIADVDVEGGLHCALTFPGRAVYRAAGVVQALTKAFKGDAADLTARGWPKDSVAKAMLPNGEYTPPTFAERYMQQELADELPDMLQTLRWTIEDILSPWTAGDKPALLAQTFKEFAAAVGQEIDDAGGFVASVVAGLAKADKAPYGDVKYADPGYQEDKQKRYPIDTEAHVRSAWSYIGQAKNAAKYTADQVGKIKGKIEAAWKRLIDKAGPPAAKAEDPELAKYNEVTGEGEFLAKAAPAAAISTSEPDSPALKAVTVLQEIVTKGFAEVKGVVEALSKAKPEDDAAQKATPPAPVVPVVPDTDPASAPHTGCQVDTAADNQASARKAIEDKATALRKAIDAEHNPNRRGQLQQEHAGLLAKLSRMP